MNANRGEAVADQDRDTPKYKNAELPCDERVADLLARMTLEEKIAQMICVWRRRVEKLVDAEGRFEAREGARGIRQRSGTWAGGRPSDAGGGLTARRRPSSPTRSSGSSSKQPAGHSGGLP